MLGLRALGNSNGTDANTEALNHNTFETVPNYREQDHLFGCLGANVRRCLSCVDVLKDSRGNFSALGAVMLLVIALLIGSGIDMSRLYIVKDSLQSACDAGALAGRRSVGSNGFDSAAQTSADNYFNANFNQAMSIPGTTTHRYTAQNGTGSAIGGGASTQINATIMALFGYTRYTLNVTCGSTLDVGNSDVTMVLDVTGSMTQTLGSTTKIAGLKTAMKNFYDTVATAAAGSNARIRYAFVPYNSTVNVGKLVYALNPDYLVNSWPIQSREVVWKYTGTGSPTGWGRAVITYGTGYSTVSTGSYTRYSSTSYSSSSQCTAALPTSTWVNNGSSTTTTSSAINGSGQKVTTTTVAQPQKATAYKCAKSGNKYYVYSASATRTFYSYTYATQDPIYGSGGTKTFNGFTYKQVTWDVSSYKAGGTLSYYNDSGTQVTTTWDGCIEERQTVAQPEFTFSSLLGISPGGADDLDIDSAPGSDNGTKWAPMVGRVAYLRGSASSPQDVDVSTTGTQSVSNFYTCPTQAQALTEMSQSAFYAYANGLSASGTTFHDIGAIWGARLSSPDGIFASVVNDPPSNGGRVSRHLIFMTDGDMNADNLIYSSYGIELHDKRTTADGSTNADAIHTSRFRAVCEVIKSKGIRLWVIAFGTTMTTDLQACASPDSAFTAADATAINTQFQQIAKQVGELRITS